MTLDAVSHSAADGRDPFQREEEPMNLRTDAATTEGGALAELRAVLLLEHEGRVRDGLV